MIREGREKARAKGAGAKKKGKRKKRKEKKDNVTGDGVWIPRGLDAGVSHERNMWRSG